ncbi:MAG: hypothetical protein ACRYGP_01050 [Janthinobacterium lividum]
MNFRATASTAAFSHRLGQLLGQGLKHQDNDLVLAEEAGLCARFMADFDAVWRSADTCKTALKTGSGCAVQKAERSTI